MPDLYEGASLEDEQMLDEVDEETQQRIDLGIKDDLEWLQKRKQAEIELNELRGEAQELQPSPVTPPKTTPITPPPQQKQTPTQTEVQPTDSGPPKPQLNRESGTPPERSLPKTPRDEVDNRTEQEKIQAAVEAEKAQGRTPDINEIKQRLGISLGKDRNFIQKAADFYTNNDVIDAIVAPATGLNDTITDAMNLVPGVNLPKKGTYSSDLAEGIRDMSAIILPMLMTRRALFKGGAAIHASKIAPTPIQKLGSDALFKKFAMFGGDIGVGVGVDAVASQSYRDLNLSGMLKQFWPKTYQFIPDSMAIDPSDAPDIKRNKHVNEGALLGLLTPIVEGIYKITKAGRSLDRVAKWVPKDQQAKRNLHALVDDPLENTHFSDNPIEDKMLRSAARQEKELDNLGAYLSRNADEFTEPVVGVHDVFDPTETMVRSKDADGILGAAVDAVRVDKNIDSTYGRLGSVITEAARKYGLEQDSLARRTLVQGLAEELKMGGKYAKELASGKVITEKQIEETGVKLAALIADPRMQVSDMKALLAEFKGELDGIKAVSSEGYRGVMKSLKSYFDQFMDLDVQKARAYLLTSETGQAADIAEGARLAGDDATILRRAQDQILDRIEYLMVEKGLASYQRGAALAHLNTWKAVKATGDTKAMKATADGFTDEVNSRLAKIIPDAKNFINTLRQVAEERPEFLKPLMLAYELTDGNVNSMYTLNKEVSNNLGVFSKAFIDLNPEIPSIMNRMWMSNLYNSTLSAFATPLRALTGNAGGLIGDPISTFYGALRAGDKDLLNRAFHQYGGVTDTFAKAWDHMKVVFRKASTDPTSVSYIVRDDIALKEADKMEVLRKFATAAEQYDEFGATALLNIYDEWEALAKHPWLRFGANSMTALDGFSRSFFAVAEAKGAAFDALYNTGRKFDENAFKEMSQKNYEAMFDNQGMITKNQRVNFSNSEVALNLDSPLVKGLDSVLKYVPAFRPFFMFPKTSMNVLDIFRKWGPTDRLHIGHKFAGDYAKFWKFKNVDDFDISEIKELLLSRGIEWDKNALTKFKMERAKLRGRTAIGTFSVMSAGFMFASGRIRGNGHWDPQRQRTRREQGWKPKTYQGWDGKWYSYEWLGPIGDWMALTVDVGDNLDSITTPIQEKFFNKMAFILGASITNKSVMSNMEPLGDILQGNPAASARWSSAFVSNAIFPLGAWRNEIGRVMDPMLREVDQEFMDLFRNRNNWIDIFDQENKLPYKYDWVDGKPVGYPEDFICRANNAYSPIKCHPDITSEKQFLIDIEYDSRPHFNKTEDGVELTNDERSELYSLVGQNGYFKRQLKLIMRDAKRLKFVETMQKIRRQGVSSSVLATEEYGSIYKRIDKALLEARRIALNQISNKDEIRSRRINNKLRQVKTTKTDVEGVLNLPVK